MKKIKYIRNPQKKVKHSKVKEANVAETIFPNSSKNDKYKVLSSIFKIITPTLNLTLFNNIKLYYESIDCESFYGIPKEYFYNEPKTKLTANIFLIIICCSIPFIPYLLKKLDNKLHLITKKFDAIYYSSLIFISIFTILSTIIAVSTSHLAKLFKSECWIKFFILIAPLILSFILSIFSYNDLKKLIKQDDNKRSFCDRLKSIKLKNIKLKNITNYNQMIYNGASVIYISVIIFLLFNILFIKVDKKKKYEVAQLEDGTSKLVITHYEDNLILMDYNMIYNTNNEEGYIVFNKGKYYIEPVDGLEIKFVNFNSVSNEGSMLVRLNMDEEEIGDEQNHYFEFRVKKNIRISDLKQIIDNVVAQESIIRNDRKFSYWYKDLENKKNFFIREDCKDINLDFDILNLYAEYE